MKKKGQVSIEFMFVIVVVVIFFTFMLTDTLKKREQIDYIDDILHKKDLCLEISSMISEVYAKGIGTQAILPIEADYVKYNITVQPVARNLFVGEGNEKPVYCIYSISSVTNDSSNNSVMWFKFNVDSNNS